MSKRILIVESDGGVSSAMRSALEGRSFTVEETADGKGAVEKVRGSRPDLSGVALTKNRDYLLESILDPNRAIAPGFEAVTVKLKAGSNYTGVVKADDDATVVIDTGEGAVVHIDKKQVDTRTKGLSPMPQDIAKPLSKRDVRNLVEFLATLKQPTTQPTPPPQQAASGQ